MGVYPEHMQTEIEKLYRGVRRSIKWGPHDTFQIHRFKDENTSLMAEYMRSFFPKSVEKYGMYQVTTGYEPSSSDDSDSLDGEHPKIVGQTGQRMIPQKQTHSTHSRQAEPRSQTLPMGEFYVKCDNGEWEPAITSDTTPQEKVELEKFAQDERIMVQRFTGLKDNDITSVDYNSQKVIRVL